jgi:hypothetical protein
MQEKHILFTFIYMYATQQDAPHRNKIFFLYLPLSFVSERATSQIVAVTECYLK